MDNLDDLMRDKAFRQAIADAENCVCKHKRTLLQLKEEQQRSLFPNREKVIFMREG
jgi:hypothetical protein